MPEIWELRQKQSLDLDSKVILSNNRIKEWYNYHDGNVYVSFSGGKDSTVLLHLVRNIYPDVPAVFIDTGLEYPEIRNFVKETNNVTWLKPKTNFKNVIEKYGYPIISKEQSLFIEEVRTTKSEYLRDVRLNGKGPKKYGKISNKWKKLVDSPFKISSKCCNVMKKKPLKEYNLQNKRYPFVGNLASEGRLRTTTYLRYGCNNFMGKNPISTPLSFWNTPDIWEYIKKYNIKYSKIYDMGYERTGCMFCMFGVHMEKQPNRFQQMEKTHPNQYKFCMNDLNLKHVLDHIGVEYKNKQITFKDDHEN